MAFKCFEWVLSKNKVSVGVMLLLKDRVHGIFISHVTPNEETKSTTTNWMLVTCGHNHPSR